MTNQKDPAAVSLGRRGGQARSAKLTDEAKVESARKAAKERWAKVAAAKYYTDWEAPAAVRLKSDADVTLMVFGKPYQVRTTPYGDDVRVEFWRNGKRMKCLFAARHGLKFWFRE